MENRALALLREASEVKAILNRKMVLSIVEMVSQKKPAELITYLEFFDMLGFENTPAEKVKMQSLVRRANRILKKEHGYFLQNVREEGYRITQHEKVIDLCEKQFRSGLKKSHRAVKETNYIRLQAIGDKLRADVIARQARLNAIMQGVNNSSQGLLE